MKPGFVVVTAAGREQGPLVECLRRMDDARPIVLATTPEGAQLEERPALILIDLDALGDEGVAALRAFRVRWPEAPLVAVGSARDEPAIDTALRAGALAYVPHAYSDSQKLLVLRLAFEGVGHRPHSVGAGAAGEPQTAAGAAAEGGPRSRKLTRKQVEVLSHAAEGLSNRQIALRLGIAEGTVKLHMSAIYTKLEVDRRGKAILVAQRLQEVRAEHIRHAEGGEQVLDWLLPHVTHKRVVRGEAIFRKGDLGSGLYYVQRGNVALEEIGVQLGPRQILGEIGVFSPEHRRTCTARCVTDVDLFCLDSEQVKSIYYLNPQFALHVVQLIAQRLLADRDRSR